MKVQSRPFLLWLKRGTKSTKVEKIKTERERETSVTYVTNVGSRMEGGSPGLVVIG